jgi:hypothetical protein
MPCASTGCYTVCSVPCDMLVYHVVCHVVCFGPCDMLVRHSASSLSWNVIMAYNVQFVIECDYGIYSVQFVMQCDHGIYSV